MSARTLKDKVAVIAGGGKNLGALIARDFADAGVRGLALHYNSDASRADTEATAATLKTRGMDVITVQGDLSVVMPAVRDANLAETVVRVSAATAAGALCR